MYVHIRHAGERHAVKCKDQEHAEATGKAVTTAIAAGQFDITALRKKPAIEKEKPATQTIGEFFNKVISPLWEASLAPATFVRYDGCCRIHIVPSLGATPLDQLDRDQVKNFVISLLKKTAPKRSHGEDAQAKESERKFSKDSIRNVVATLRAMLNEALERKLITANPASRLGKLYKEAGTVREQVDPFTAEEIPLLLDSTRKFHGHQNYVMTLTLFHTGIRASELAGLQWADVDFRGRFITVRRQYKDGEITRTKTKKIRKVDISDVLLTELQTLKRQRREEYLAKGKNEIPDWVFLSPGQIIWSEGTKPRRGGRKPIGRKEGEPINMKNFRNRVFLKACDKAQIRRRRVHDTRHTFASILLMAKVRHTSKTSLDTVRSK